MTHIYKHTTVGKHIYYSVQKTISVANHTHDIITEDNIFYSALVVVVASELLVQPHQIPANKWK